MEGSFCDTYVCTYKPTAPACAHCHCHSLPIPYCALPSLPPLPTWRQCRPSVPASQRPSCLRTSGRVSSWEIPPRRPLLVGWVRRYSRQTCLSTAPFRRPAALRHSVRQTSLSTLRDSTFLKTETEFEFTPPMDRQPTQSATPARGRSPSAGHQQPHIRNTHSPSPHPYQSQDASIGLGIGLDPSSSTSPQFVPDNFNDFGRTDNRFLTSSQPQTFSQQGAPDTIPFDPSQPGFSQALLTGDFTTSTDFCLFPPATQADQFGAAQLFGDTAQNHSSILNANNLANMTSPQTHHSPTPPHLLKPEPGSTHHSPSFNQQQFSSPPGHHSRHASLGPEAALLPGQVDWTQAQFQRHRRTPSDYSDVSSNAASPSLTAHDRFDPEHGHSPMQQPQDNFYDGVMGLGNFSISDPNRNSRSPSHSPHISPRIMPQMPEIGQPNQPMMLNTGYQSGPAVSYPMQPEEFPTLQQEMPMEQQIPQGMAPPSINIDFAPNAKQNAFEPLKPPMDESSLTPPDRGNITPGICALELYD